MGRLRGASVSLRGSRWRSGSSRSAAVFGRACGRRRRAFIYGAKLQAVSRTGVRRHDRFGRKDQGAGRFAAERRVLALGRDLDAMNDTILDVQIDEVEG